MSHIFPRFFPLLTILVVILAACSREIADPKHQNTDQYAYFPLEMGKYVVYAVDSVIYDFSTGGGTVRDSSRTLVKEIVSDTLRDNLGQMLYQIERYERASDTSGWELRSITSARRTNSLATRTENNLPFLKLVFPMDKRSEWDGNLWIDVNREIEIAGERMRPFTNWNYEVDSIDVPQQIGQFAFDSVLVVTEADDNNVIERRLSRVKYAKHVGVVWREQLIFDSQYCNQSPPPDDCTSKPWAEKAEKGYILRQVVLEFN
ncbi:MAG: hypothetical protein LH618_15910 [Saprospiraceae bacterium]|nr:hypothetical protein [Saprospiraceae bacterium]